MKITLPLKKNLHQVASSYFDEGKEAREKVKRIEEAIHDLEGRKAKLERENQKEKEQGKGKKGFEKKRSREWFEKFHWFHSSEGFLVLGGRDASSNEQLVKKHMQPSDFFLHADIVGAPHCIVKSEGREIGQKTKEEGAVFAASFSRAWREGLAGIDVYGAQPEQVSKQAPSGESIGRGAFLVYGTREWFRDTGLLLALGWDEGKKRIVSGPLSAISSQARHLVTVTPGDLEKGETAKRIKNNLGSKLSGEELSLDEIQRMLPAGRFRVRETERN